MELVFKCKDCGKEYSSKELWKIKDTEVNGVIYNDHVCPDCSCYEFTIYSKEDI